MKKLKLFFACLLMAVLSIGQVWGLTNTYTKITSATSLDESAEYVIGDVDNYGCPTNTGGTSINTTEASWVHWNAKNVEGGFYLYNGAVYLKVPASNAWGNGTSSDCSVLTANSEGILSGNDGTNARILVKNSSNAYLRWYKSGQTKAYLYKIEASSSTACATPTFSPETGSYEGTQNVTITSTEGATIYYTTDGSTPTTSSSVYSSAIPVAADMTIKAFAVKSGLDDSDVATAAYEITEGPDVTIAFVGNTNWNIPSGSGKKTVAEGTYTDGTYTIKVAGSTGEGYYINGYLFLGKTGAYVELPEFSNPVEKIVVVGTSGGSTGVKFNIYDGTTAVSTEVTGCKNVSQEFTIENPEANKAYRVQVTSNANLQISAIKIFFGSAPAVAKPTISGDENFLTSTEVTITCSTGGATIYYTDDDTDPKTSGTKKTYSAPFSVSSTTKIRAIANLSSDWSAEATSKTFIKIDPINVPAAIALIPNADDVVDDQFVWGIVCTAAPSLLSGGKLTYYISADGSETNRLQIYKGRNLNNTDFTAVSDVAIGDRVIVFGQLKNYNGTPEMNDGNYLVVKDAPAVEAPVFSPNGGGFMGETDVTITCSTAGSTIYYTLDGTTPSKSSSVYSKPIHLDATTTITAVAYVGDDASLVIAKTFTLTAPMTVADALTALDSENPINNVAVAGIISTAPTSNPSSGRLTYYISDDGSDTDELEVFLGFGLNGASFSNKTDLQVGDEVTIFGNLKIFSGSSGDVKEFDAGNRLLAFNRPVVPVSSVELASAATVKVGNSINLSASVLPANATDKVIEWSIQSGNDNITLDNGAVTGVAEGTAVVRATSHADNTKYAECTITIEAADPTYAYYFYGKVTETAGIEDGQYLIVYEDESVAFNGGLETLDAAHNTIAVEIEDGLIVSNTTTDAASFTIGVTAGTIQAAMGDYIGVTSYSNGLKQNADATTYPAHSFSIDEEGNAIVSLNNGWSGTMILNYNTGSSDKRFRYYKGGSQKKIQLYKRFGTDVAPKANPQLAWDPADDIEITVGDEFTAPTLTYVEGFDGVAAVAIESDNTDLAKVTAGVVSLVADATGEANITATFAGNDNYKAATASYKITVNASVVPPTPAVSGNIVILAEYNSKFYAMTNSLTSGALAGVEVEKDGSKIVVSSAEDKAAIQWTATVDGDNTTLKDAENNYIKGSSGSSLSLEADPYNWNWDGEKSCYISSAYTTRGLFFNSANNVFKGYALSNITSDGYAATEVIEIDPEDIVITSKADPELAYNPASVEITIGDAWSAPELTYASGFDGLAAVTYASNNEAVATVSDAGVIALAGGTGTATITASFAGNANYLLGSATYTIKVNEVPDNCDATDDFSTANSSSPTSYTTRTTDAGWGATNAGYKVINDASYLMINGKTTAVGVITSPVLSDGIASLKFRYANTNNESNGVSVRIDIKQGTEVVKTYTLTKANSEVTKDVVYTEIIENINVAGEFQIIFTNLSPSNNTGNADRVSIGRLCWKNYSSTPEPTPDYTRTVEINRYGTICLPNGGNISGAKLFDLEYYDGANTLYLLEVNGNAMVAGRPYIFLPSATTIQVFYTDNANASAGSYHGLVGSYSQQQVPIGATEEEKNYILYENAYYLVNSIAYVGANRAYIHMADVPTEPSTPQVGQAPRRRVGMTVHGEQTTTDIDALNAAEAPVKVMINGQMYILRGEKMYDATGRLVK